MSAYCVHPDVIAAPVGDGERLLLHVATGDYYSMNATASFLWSRLEQGATPAEAAASLADQFEVEPAEAGEHVARLIQDLQTRKLITQDAV